MRTLHVPIFFRGRASSIPESVSGLELWLKADAGTDVDTDDAAVGEWQDQSGKGRHVVQATTAKKPLFKTGVFGDLPSIRFDGTDDVMASAAFAAALTQPTTIYATFKNITAGTTQILMDGQAQRQQIVPVSGGGGYIFAGSALAGGADYDGATPRILVARFNGVNSNWYVDGDTAEASGDAGAGGLDRLVLASDSVAGGSTYGDGDYGEILIYSGLHDAETVNLIGAYLQRWGASWTEIS